LTAHKHKQHKKEPPIERKIDHIEHEVEEIEDEVKRIEEILEASNRGKVRSFMIVQGD